MKKKLKSKKKKKSLSMRLYKRGLRGLSYGTLVRMWPKRGKPQKEGVKVGLRGK